MYKLIFWLLFLVITTGASAQRGTNSSEMTPMELKQQRFEDSMQKKRDEFERNFSTTEYFRKLKEIKLKNDSIQLNETLAYFESIEPFADTFTHLTIQSSALSVFPGSVRKFKNLKTLTLRRCQSVHLEALFEQLKDLPLLAELQILYSEKTALPNNISLLRRLKVLDLNGNKLNELPEGLAGMPLLEFINLHNNPYIDLDNAAKILSKLASLKKVKISGCKLVNLGENLAQLSQIEVLDLSHNSIEALPTNIGTMVKLKVIDLAKNSKLNSRQIFSALLPIPHLEELDLSDCNLTELGAEIGTMVRLKKLILTNNPIKKVQTEIGNLTLLEELYLGAGISQKEVSPLAELPTSLGNCKNLRKLDLRMCQLTSLPASFSQLGNLSYIDLSWNKFTAFPSVFRSISSVNYLDLSYNKINEFPSDIGLLAMSLETLMLEANFYAPYTEKINKIPPSLARCKNLKKLSLKDQVYETLPDRFWFDLTKLEDLNLMGALLQEIPESIENLIELRSLNIKSNEIKRLAGSIAKLTKLENFNISHNPEINATELLASIQAMKQLKFVDLSYNDIKRELLEPIAAQMPQTKFMKLETKDSPAYENPKRR
jgi:Leucine-rich repeat (LRR) protein